MTWRRRREVLLAVLLAVVGEARKLLNVPQHMRCAHRIKSPFKYPASGSEPR